MFTMLDARIVSALKKIIQNTNFKKKVSLEEQKAQKEDRFLRGRQIAYMIYDYFQVTGAHDTVLDYPYFFSITLRNEYVQEFDTRWEFHYLWPRSTWWCPGKFVQIKNTWVWSTQNLVRIVWHGNSSENIDAWLSKVENDGEEKHRSETSITKFSHLKWEIETGAVVTSRRRWSGVERGQGVCYQWKAKKAVFERSDGGWTCKNRHQKPLHPLSHRHKEVDVRRKKKNSEAGVDLESSIDSRAKTFWKSTCTKSPCDCWHPPECQFYESESGCTFGAECSFAHRQVDGQPSKKPKKSG